MLALGGRGLRAEAKRLQLAAAARPLTVCFGYRARPVPGGRPWVSPYGDGCGLVCPDSTGLRRPSFRYYCPRCQARQSELARKARARALATRYGRFPLLAYDAQGNPVSAWWGSCSRCTDEFVHTDPRARRCERCRRGHR